MVSKEVRSRRQGESRINKRTGITNKLVYPALCLVILLFSSGMIGHTNNANAAVSTRTIVTPVPPGPLHVQDNSIVDSAGHPFLLRGAMIEGLNVAHPELFPVAQQTIEHFTLANFQVMRQRWNMNAVRLPLSIESFRLHRNYLAWVSLVVQLANQAGLLVVLDLHAGTSTHGYPYPNVHLPTSDALRFWRLVATQFRNNPHVMFDLFNEPDSRGIPNHDPNISKDDWTVWLLGGTQNGHTVVGMQDLVDTIRATGAQQIVMAEGLATATTFHNVEGNLIQDDNVVYEIHPYFGPQSGPAEWDYNFGFLADIYPVYAGEWGVLPGFSPACRNVTPAQAPGKVLALLDYFDAHRISWTVYGFMPGMLFLNYATYKPTTLNVPWVCGQVTRNGEPPSGAGMGEIIWQRLGGH